MKDTQKLKRMSPELFLQLFPKTSGSYSLDQIISILDSGEYWDNRRDYTLKQKQAHIKRRLKMKTHDGRGFNLFISWPAPFQPTFYQLSVRTYNHHILGKEDEDENSVNNEEWPDLIDG